MNPRFGGGYATAILCGKNYFERYISNRPNTKFEDYPIGERTVRYESTILTNRES